MGRKFFSFIIENILKKKGELFFSGILSCSGKEERMSIQTYFYNVLSVLND